MPFPQWIYNIPINFSFHIWYLKNVTLCQLNVWMGNGDSRSSFCFRGFSWFAQPNWLHNTIPYHTGLNQPSWAHSTKLGPTNLFLNLFGGDFRSKKWTSCFQIHWTILPFLYSQWYSLATVFLQVSILFTDDKREMTDANSLDPQRQSLPVAEICTIDPLLVHLFYSIKYRADATQIYNVCGTNIKKSVSIQQQIGNKTSQWSSRLSIFLSQNLSQCFKFGFWSGNHSTWRFFNGSSPLLVKRWIPQKPSQDWF